jgi:hypothetical protein
MVTDVIGLGVIVHNGEAQALAGKTVARLLVLVPITISAQSIKETNINTTYRAIATR